MATIDDEEESDGHLIKLNLNMTASIKSTARCSSRLHKKSLLFAVLFSLGVVPQSEATTQNAAAAASAGDDGVGMISVHAQLYPPYEEYDYSILDPYHAYGSPYGGFSRATRTRLASLPLYLPETSEDEPRPDALHTTLRDAEGRLFACRVYHEDELDPSSIGESMFEPPRFRTTTTTALENKDSAADGSSSSSSDETTTPAAEDDMDKNALPPSPAGPREILSSINMAMLDINVEERLGQLHGLCGQVHKGWWSYEWCYKKEVTQFHVHVFNERDFEVQDITSLGTYFERKIHLDLTDLEKNELADDIAEMARVVDYHSDGEYCEATDQPRVTYVKLQCCSASNMEESKGVVHRDSIPISSDLLSLHDFIEDPDRVCTYNATVCTPILCLDDGPDGETLLQLMNQSSKKDRHLAASDNETILEILHRTLDGLCLQSVTGGWWTYEFCHGKGIRQYHEVVGTKKTSTGSSFTAKVTETEHQLGRFQPDSIQNIMNEAEWKLVVNATDKKGGVTQSYFELEYQDGDICDHSDVTESAIIAGAVAGAKKAGGLARSSSVRYYCGEKYDVSVSEDSTCHYLVKVNVPDLCRHPLFAAPVSKKQIVKCLQSDEFL